MATIVLRTVKGSPLTVEEADANFSNINQEVGVKLDATEFTAANILDLLSVVPGEGSGLDTDTIRLLAPDVDAVANTLVSRDGSSQIYASTFLGDLVGDVTGNLVGNVTGTVTGNATNVSGIVALGNGGTGATDSSGARTNLGLGNMAVQNSSDVTITGGTITGITALTIANGGTGAINAAQARTNLGLVLGTDVQPFNNNLTAVSNISTTGFISRTGAAAATSRTITGSNSITVTNGDGVSGNPTITLSLNPTVSSIVKSGTNGVGDIGSSGNKFGTIYGTATSAKYADLAEKYLADAEYPVGTVMMVGGDAEVTASKLGYRAIGVVSENPAYMMNSELEGGTYIALKGRVPVRVVGTIRKGNKVIASDDGLGSVEYVAHSSDYFAISLEDSDDTGIKIVECVIL